MPCICKNKVISLEKKVFEASILYIKQKKNRKRSLTATRIFNIKRKFWQNILFEQLEISTFQHRQHLKKFL